MPNEAFLDTAYAIALASPKDLFHADAIQIAAELAEKNTRLVTTRGVLLEIGNALSKPRFRDAAARLLASIEADRTIDVMPVSEELYETALRLFCNRPDKDWGMTDCLSFVVMQMRGIEEALTADDHFRQAGFRVRLRR